MIEVVVAGLVQDAPDVVAVLFDQAGRRALPIWVWGSATWQIDMAFDGWRFLFPLSFDLMANLLEAVDTDLEAVRITTLAGDLVRCTVRIRRSGKVQDVEANPSDAITLAVIMDRPIYVAEDVMDQAGVAVLAEVRETGASRQMFDDAALKRIVTEAVQKRAFRVDEVVEGVYISGVRRQPPIATLREKGITRVLKLYHGDVSWPDDFWVYDNTAPDNAVLPWATVQRGVAFIREQRAAGEKVLVVCYEGISRSSTFVLAYLVEALDFDLHDAWRLLRERHHKAWPAKQLWASLLAHYGPPYSLADVRAWLGIEAPRLPEID